MAPADFSRQASLRYFRKIKLFAASVIPPRIGLYLSILHNAIQKIQNPKKFVAHSGANENRKKLDSKKNFCEGSNLGQATPELGITVPC